MIDKIPKPRESFKLPALLAIDDVEHRDKQEEDAVVSGPVRSRDFLESLSLRPRVFKLVSSLLCAYDGLSVSAPSSPVADGGSSTRAPSKSRMRG